MAEGVQGRQIGDDRRLAENPSGKRKVVVVLRERGARDVAQRVPQ